MDLSEIYKMVGATLGFVATIFAVWDRMFRYRPFVSITAQQNIGGAGSRALLRVKNQAPYDIVIEQICSSSSYYRVDSADSILGMIHGVTARQAPILLAPGEQRFLRIAESEIAGVAAKDSFDRFRFEICWSRGDHPYLKPISVRLRTSPADMERRKRAAELWADEQAKA